MREPQGKTIHLKDYAPPAFRVEAIELDIDIRADDALVKAKLQVRRNSPGPLVLDGDELELKSVSLNGKPVQHTVTAEKLTIENVPDSFELETLTRIVPQKNTKLEGLYATKHGFVTQCEAEGFRRITWYIDRPDVMARFTTTVRAAFPVLLSNGNLVASGPGWAKFVDPFPKPSYLFALVAAKLEVLHEKNLYVYVEPGKLDQAGWAMDCLKRAIAWDEKRFGLKLDLDEYRIVAVGDFNSGAMENKGLNIFNTKYVLACAETATDTDYLNIDRVVAHEYFHNWTGNRVTCRDWFQLSLKEGLTVFRDQEYGADTYSRAVTRIQEVQALHAQQSMNPPFHIPFAVKVGAEEKVLSLKKTEEKFIFSVKAKPVPSLLRRFSAPVILNYPYSEDELVHLMAHDDDAFNRWEAGQRLAAAIVLDKKGEPGRAFVDAARRLLGDPDPAFAAEA